MYNFHVQLVKSFNRPRKIYLYPKADVDGLKSFHSQCSYTFYDKIIEHDR